VNEGNVFADKTVALTADVDLAGHNWIPIGDCRAISGGNAGFAGYYDGGGYSVAGLRVNLSGATVFAGLFGWVKGGSVSDLQVSGSVTAAASGPCYAGSIAGQSYGAVTGCTSSADVSISGSETLCAGGIAGISTDEIENCTVTGSVSAVSDSDVCFVGGIVSDAETVRDCSNSGSVFASDLNGAYAGGIAATCRHAATGCLNTGSVSARSTHTGCAAGIADMMDSGDNTNNVVRMTNCMNRGAVTCYATANSATYAAGLACMPSGSGQVILENSCNTGSVTNDLTVAGEDPYAQTGGVMSDSLLWNTKIWNCYNAGAVTGTDGATGGLLSSNTSGAVANCYWLTDASGSPGAGSLVLASCGSFADNLGALTLAGTESDTNKLAAGTLLAALNAWVTVQTKPNSYEKWTVNANINGGYPILGAEYTVTLNVNGGTALTTATFTAMNGSTYGAAYGAADASLPAPARTGYTFAGWNTTEDGSGSEIKATDTVSLTADTILYAKWTANAYTVAYDGNAPAAATHTVSHLSGGSTDETYDQSFTLAAAPELTGWTFGGWYLEAACTNKAGNARASVSNLTAVSGGSVTLYAKWTANTYTVSFDLGYPGGGNPNSMEVTYDAVYGTLPAPTRAGYRFGGWFTAESGGTQITADTLVDMTENTKLYARWIANVPGGGTVTFVTNGGSAIDPVTKSAGTELELSDYVPTRKGYDFAGWYLDAALTQPVSGLTVRGSVTLYAKWTWHNPFADVESGDWFYDDVAYAVQNGLFAGTSGTAFSPDASMTRGMLWTVLARLAGVKTDAAANVHYYDVARTWAMEQGLTDGTNPDAPVTREQLAAILYRYATRKGYDTTQGGMAIREFADYAGISSWAGEAMTWAVNAGLLNGSANYLQPQGTATRAQVAAILHRFCEKLAK